MVARVNAIARKRSTLKGQITALKNLVSENTIDNANARLRLERLTELYHAYELLHEELEEIDAENEGIAQFTEIQNGFYEIAALIKVPSNPSAANDTANTTIGNSTLIERQRLLKLPVANLPQFDGDHANWLSFKNIFLSMIDTHKELDDTTKFIYLRDSLTGSASNKLARFHASAENYDKAWKLLTECYEKKRILVTRHYDAILNITPLKVVTPNGLTSMIDDVRQHINMLQSLQVNPDQGIIIRLLERALPAEVRQEWERALSLDELPNLDDLCKFVTEFSFRLAIDPAKSKVPSNNSSKRRNASNNDKQNASKTIKLDNGARALATSVESSCPSCGEAHRLYSCQKFKNLAINKRWELVKAKQLCKNCLRSHAGNCKASCCKKCPRYHNTLLHSDPQNRQNNNQQQVNSSAKDDSRDKAGQS